MRAACGVTVAGQVCVRQAENEIARQGQEPTVVCGHVCYTNV